LEEDLKDYGEYYEHDKYIKEFAAKFPQLEHLDTANPNYAFYTQLYIARNDLQQFKFLKSMTMPTNDNTGMIYIHCALKYRDSLTQLFLCDYISSGRFFQRDGIPRELKLQLLNQRLNEFPQLSDLKFVKHSHSNCLADDLDYIIDSCSNSLKFLDVQIQLPEGINRTEQHQQIQARI
jgi:hypothetical protein